MKKRYFYYSLATWFYALFRHKNDCLSFRLNVRLVVSQWQDCLRPYRFPASHTRSSTNCTQSFLFSLSSLPQDWVALLLFWLYVHRNDDGWFLLWKNIDPPTLFLEESAIKLVAQNVTRQWLFALLRQKPKKGVQRPSCNLFGRIFSGQFFYCRCNMRKCSSILYNALMSAPLPHFKTSKSQSNLLTCLK